MKETIEFSDFLKIDIRVGKIVKATAPEWSAKLLQFEVDLGDEIGQRTILSGVRKWYTPEDFEGKQFAFVVNLAPRKMGEATSQGMMLMSIHEEVGQDGAAETLTRFTIPETAQPGDYIS